MLNLQLQSGPIAEPLTLAQAKQQLRLDANFTDDDALITGLLAAVREVAEKYTRRAFFNQTWVLSLDQFPLWNYASGTVNPASRKAYPYYSSYWDPLAIRLPKPRCLRVLSITYVDITNTQQTIDPSMYVVDTISEPARVVPIQPFVWPSTLLYIPGSVQVTFEAASYVQAATQNVTVPSESPYTAQLTGTVTGVELVTASGTPPTGITGSTTSNSADITLSSGTGVAIGMGISGSGIPSNTTLISGSGTSWVMSANPTATAAGVALTFTNAVVTGWTLSSSGLLTFPAGNAGQALTVNCSLANCPQSLQSAQLLLLDDLYENRLPVQPDNVQISWTLKVLLDLHTFEQFTYENGN